ncbi:MAG: hypothetical protein WA101_00150 [Minisyncoccia bacterium]
MKKISKFQIFKWKLQENWQYSFIRKITKIFCAYVKLAWALRFCKNEFSKLLRIDTEAMIVMPPYEQRKYDFILSKVRAKIGNHGFLKYTLKKFFKDVFEKEKSYNDNALEKQIMELY